VKDISTPGPLPAVAVTDGRVALRSWRPQDAAVRVRAGADADVQRWTSVPRNVDEAAALAWVNWSERARHDRKALYAAVTLDGECLGSVGLVDLHPNHRRAEIGYWLLDEARGHGLAVKALRLFTSWCFVHLDVARLDLFTNTDNEASMAVALKAGYAREALLRSWHGDSVHREDLVLFGMLREEWPDAASQQ
jgi:ribosomal-protein-alanine N-acetyltransferase